MTTSIDVHAVLHVVYATHNGTTYFTASYHDVKRALALREILNHEENENDPHKRVWLVMPVAVCDAFILDTNDEKFYQALDQLEKAVDRFEKSW